jgi:hypothetical protein
MIPTVSRAVLIAVAGYGVLAAPGASVREEGAAPETLVGGAFRLVGSIAPPPAPAAPCYANCDGSTGTPALSAADLTCFLKRFAAGEAWANCDGSTAPPVLNAADVACFLTKLAEGCP